MRYYKQVKKVIVFLAISLVGCMSNKVIDYNNASEWLKDYRSQDGSLVFQEGIEIEYTLAREEYKEYYIRQLDLNYYIELNPGEYFLMTNKFLEKKHCFAIRAVYTHKTGRYFVLKNEENIYLVYYAHNGTKYWALNKDVLIIEADELPKELYIGCSGVRLETLKKYSKLVARKE
jgi:hypothetical protein